MQKENVLIKEIEGREVSFRINPKWILFYV
jgi:hypothetical protein